MWYNTLYGRRRRMYLKQSHNKSTGKTQLSFVQGYRQNGKVKHKVIENLGFLEDYIGVYDDPISHFKKVAKQRNEAVSMEKTLEVNLGTKLLPGSNLRKNLGYAVAKSIYAQLDVREFFQNKQRQLKIEYNLNGIFSLLVFNRFLYPTSKKAAYDNRDAFFEPADFSLDDVYRSLDHFAKYSKALQKHLREKVSAMFPSENKLGYYDVTNYYFEIPYEDEDIHDENGELIKKGTRKRGPSKEHRKDPIVQMGLLMDSNAMPMAFDLFAGNESEKTAMLPAVRRAKRDFGLEKIIVVADRGLNTSDNTALLSGINNDDSQGHDGYVYGQSVLGADAEFKSWVLDQNGYETSKETDKDGSEVSFKHKSRVFAKNVTMKKSDGKRTHRMVIYQKQMAYYSEKYAKKQACDRARAVAKAEALIANPGNYTRATSYGAAAYVKNLKFVKSTGEIPDGLDLSIDTEKIENEAKYDGCYSIVTSEKNLSDQQIRDIYKGLWEIEESFKIIKSEFRARPVYVRTDEHIEAHFLTCFVALILLRILEKRTGEKHSVKALRNSLRGYCCSHLDQNYYLFDYRDNVLEHIEDVFGFDFSKKIMSLEEIKKTLKYKR